MASSIEEFCKSCIADEGGGAMRYEVTRYAPGQVGAEPTVTDAAGVTELVRLAALNGVRVHIRPIADPAGPTDETLRNRSIES
jgi:hypothetical protein